MTAAPLSLNVRMMKAEVTETLLYRCVTRTLNAIHCDKLRKAHLGVLKQVLDFQCCADHTNLSYAKVLKNTNARASKRPSGNGVSSSRGQWYGETRGGYPVGRCSRT